MFTHIDFDCVGSSMDINTMDTNINVRFSYSECLNINIPPPKKKKIM